MKRLNETLMPDEVIVGGPVAVERGLSNSETIRDVGIITATNRRFIYLGRLEIVRTQYSTFHDRITEISFSKGWLGGFLKVSTSREVETFHGLVSNKKKLIEFARVFTETHAEVIRNSSS